MVVLSDALRHREEDTVRRGDPPSPGYGGQVHGLEHGLPRRRAPRSDERAQPLFAIETQSQIEPVHRAN